MEYYLRMVFVLISIHLKGISMWVFQPIAVIEKKTLL